MQYLAFNFETVPSGMHLQQKTHVPGRILDSAWRMSTSSHVPFASNAEISFTAASNYPWWLTVSAITSSKGKVSRSELDALNTKGVKKPFSW